MDVDLSSKLPHISIRAETLFTIPTPLGEFHFTNSMLFTLIIVAALTIFFAMATRRMSLVPKRGQNLAEALVEFLLGVTEGTAGRSVGRRIFPLIATLFLFIIVANWSGLLPGVGTIGACYRVEEHATGQGAGLVVKTSLPALQEASGKSGGLPSPTGNECPEGTEFIPFLRAANADLNTTLAMALLAVAVVQISGIAAHGVGGYLKELMTPWYLTPIHIIGEISRVISLSFRLFGNIFGGEVLVTVMYVLMGSLLLGFGTVIFLGLEMLFGFIQALLFSILTLVYITTAVQGHGTEGGHDAPHAAEGTAEAMGQQVAHVLTGQGGPARGDTGREGAEGTAQHLGG